MSFDPPSIASLYSSITTAFAIRSYWITLKDYFSPVIRKTKKRLKGEYFEYDMDSDGDLLFWRDLLKSEFHNPTDKKVEDSSNFLRVGNVIELNNSNISRWVPFFPGKKYSVEGKSVLDKHREMFPKNHEFGLEEELVLRNDSIVLSGSATVRLLPYNHQYLLCSSGLLCETGIPILMSEKLYNEKIQENISSNGCLNATIVGTLRELPGEWKDRIDQNLLKENYPDVYGLPRIVLSVDEIKKIGTPRYTVAQAWTQFIDVKNSKYSAMMSSVFTPMDAEDIQKAVNMIANYQQFLESGLIGGKWNIDVEFDETRNWFRSGKFTRYDANEIELFGLYYSNPWGRVLLDKKRGHDFDESKRKSKH